MSNRFRLRAITAISLFALLMGLTVVPTEAQTERRRRPRKTTGSCEGLWVDAPESPKPRGRTRRGASFSASEILDLKFIVSMPAGGVTDEKVELKLYTPKGHLYQTLSAKLELQPERDRARKRRTTSRFATAILPVAGTTIVTSSLYGKWKAEAYVEGDGAPCTTPRSFVVQP